MTDSFLKSFARGHSARLAGLMVFASIASPAAASSQLEQKLDSMAGVWCGSARIVVDWTAQKKLGLTLAIDPSGNVTGQVGDARLVAGRLKTNRGVLGRMFGIKTDYIVVGRLEGPIIAAEGIERTGVSIPLNWTGSNFAGAVHTDGSKFGGKKQMGLSASHLVLRRWMVPAKRDVSGCA